MIKSLKKIRKNILGIYSDIFKYIYFEPIGLQRLVDEENAWYLKNNIIPHAMGAISGKSYTNSKEALENILTRGFCITEVDISLTSDKIPVCVHELSDNVTFEIFMNSKIENKFSPLSLEMLVNYVRENPKLYILLDIKHLQEEVVARWIKENANDVANRFIIQISSPSIYKKIIKIYKFKYFHYNFSVDGNVNKNLKFVVKNNIFTCSVATKNIKSEKTLKYLNKYNVKTFIYTVNAQEQMHLLFRKGVYGIMTDNIDINVDKNKKKILVVPGHSRAIHKYGMVAETIKKLLDNKDNEVYFLDCNKQATGYCGLNKSVHWGYCDKCSPMCLKMAKLAGLKDENILKLKNVKAPKFPKFKTLSEALLYEFEGYQYGLAPVSTVMTLTRDYAFDIKKYNKLIQRYLRTEYIYFKNLEELDSIYNFDEIHVYNGRMPSMYPGISYSRRHKKTFVVYDRGAGIGYMQEYRNSVPHDLPVMREDIQNCWRKENPAKLELANKWFSDRRKGTVHSLELYTANQIKDLLPSDFDSSKENFVFFNSSIDEVFAFDSWKHPFVNNENEILESLFEHYKNDENKHFYLRVHPNLTKAKKKHTTQIKQIEQMKSRYKNLTVIEPDEKIDTYALMEACDKVLSTYSTMGCEATYWGKVSVIAGIAPYDELDCVYQAKSLDDFYRLIDDKNLVPKQKENALPYGYRNQVHGEAYKFFKENSLNDGEFLGNKL